MRSVFRAIAAIAIVAAAASPLAAQRLLNASSDPTRELYADFNAAFVKYWQAKTGRPSRSSSRTAAPARRRARSSTASTPTS